MITRRKSRKVYVGGVPIGGDAPITVQTMTKTKTSDIEATVRQIKEAEEAGCDIIRVTVNDKEAAEAIKEIVRRSNIPIVADIHFNHIFALKAIEAGVCKSQNQSGKYRFRRKN
jgi:(E)-4-hydroxy-3-methylbut-2-enyl-diphosphate synthase